MSTKIFCHRTYSAIKNLPPRSIHEAQAPPPLVSLPPSQAAGDDQAKHERMLERARIKAELREHLRPKSIVHEIDKGIIRMLSVEICHAITYHDALMKRGLSEMDAVKKIAPLVDQFLHKQAFCLMCGRQFNGWKHILPTLILKAIPVPPHKKPRLKALALCDDCSYYDNRNDNIVETICFAYTCLSNPATLALFKDNLAEWPLFKKWKAAIEMAAFHNVYLVDPELKR